jgi:hypothetical protein
MAIRAELTLRLPNSPGALREFCDTLSDGKINLLALHLDGSGRLRCVVDNPLLAAELLRPHHAVESRDVLYVSLANTPGSLAGAARLLAESGVNVEYAYAASVEGSTMAAVVVGVADAQRASSLAGL